MNNFKKFRTPSDLADYLVLKALSKFLYEPEIADKFRSYVEFFADALDLSAKETSEITQEAMSIRLNLAKKLLNDARKHFRNEEGD